MCGEMHTKTSCQQQVSGRHLSTLIIIIEKTQCTRHLRRPSSSTMAGWQASAVTERMRTDPGGNFDSCMTQHIEGMHRNWRPGRRSPLHELSANTPKHLGKEEGSWKNLQLESGKHPSIVFLIALLRETRRVQRTTPPAYSLQCRSRAHQSSLSSETP